MLTIISIHEMTIESQLSTVSNIDLKVPHFKHKRHVDSKSKFILN